MASQEETQGANFVPDEGAIRAAYDQAEPYVRAPLPRFVTKASVKWCPIARAAILSSVRTAVPGCTRAIEAARGGPRRQLGVQSEVVPARATYTQGEGEGELEAGCCCSIELAKLRAKLGVPHVRLLVVCAARPVITAVCSCGTELAAGQQCDRCTRTQILIANPGHPACQTVREWPNGGLSRAQRLNIDRANDIVGFDGGSQMWDATVEALENLGTRPHLHSAKIGSAAELGDRALRRVEHPLL